MDFHTGKPTNNFEHLGIIHYNFTTQIDQKTLGQTIFGNKNDISFGQGMKELEKLARELNGDLIYDMKISTAIGNFDNGSYLYTTIYANVGRYQ